MHEHSDRLQGPIMDTHSSKVEPNDFVAWNANALNNPKKPRGFQRGFTKEPEVLEGSNKTPRPASCGLPTSDSVCERPLAGIMAMAAMWIAGWETWAGSNA